MYRKIQKEHIYNSTVTTNFLKIPRGPKPQITKDFQGNIIFDTFDNTFYGYTGTKWVPFNGYASSSGKYVTWGLDTDLPDSKQLIAGTDLTLDFTTPGQIILNANGASNVTLTNPTPTSTDEPLVKDGVGPALELKNLRSGAGITLTSTPDIVEIGLGAAPPATNVSFITANDESGVLSQSRQLATSGSDITITDNGAGSTLVLAVNGASGVTLNNAGVGTSLVNDGIGPTLALKSLTAGFGISFGGDATNITINSNTSTSYIRTIVTIAQSPYTALVTDDIIAVQSGGGSITINLPNIGLLGTTNNYKKYIIVDEGGAASVNNIIINAFAGQNIIGNSTIIINGNYNSTTIYSDGNNSWFVI